MMYSEVSHTSLDSSSITALDTDVSTLSVDFSGFISEYSCNDVLEFWSDMSFNICCNGFECEMFVLMFSMFFELVNTSGLLLEQFSQPLL